VAGTPGDSLLIEYSSVVATVEASIAVQEGMVERNAALPEDRRTLLQLGINIGEVIIDGDDIFGDGVNVAARLQEIATAGGIAMSGKAHEEVADNLEAKFADGVTEDIITALLRIRWFFVIARNIASTYQNQAMDVQAVARELGVRYILEGSVRKAGNRIRVTVQLIDGANGQKLWPSAMTGTCRTSSIYGTRSPKPRSAPSNRRSPRRNWTGPRPSGRKTEMPGVYACGHGPKFICSPTRPWRKPPACAGAPSKENPI